MSELDDSELGEYVGDWQTCPSCGRRFDAADDTGLGFGGCPEGNCVACEKCCTCEEGSGSRTDLLKEARELNAQRTHLIYRVRRYCAVQP